MTKKKATAYTHKQVDRMLQQRLGGFAREAAERDVELRESEQARQQLRNQIVALSAALDAARATLSAPTTHKAKFGFGDRVFVALDGGEFKPGIVTSVAFSGEDQSQALGVCFAAGQDFATFGADDVHARDANPAFAIPGESDVILQVKTARWDKPMLGGADDFGVIAVDGEQPTPVHGFGEEGQWGN